MESTFKPSYVLNVRNACERRPPTTCFLYQPSLNCSVMEAIINFAVCQTLEQHRMT